MVRFLVSRFRLIFSVQNLSLVLGGRKCVGHPCQKHPSTKTAMCFEALAMSGVPGIALAWHLYRPPFRQTADLSSNSGRVFFPRILDIVLERPGSTGAPSKYDSSGGLFRMCDVEASLTRNRCPDRGIWLLVETFRFPASFRSRLITAGDQHVDAPSRVRALRRGWGVPTRPGKI